MEPDGKTPGPYKRYYDFFTYIVTQLTISFVVVPFQFLTLPDSIKVWARVYFYGVIGTAICFGLLNSPVKGMLIKKVKTRSSAAGLEKVASQTSISEHDMQSTLGLPHDPEFEMQEFIKGVREEVEARKRRGSTVPDFKVVLQQKLDEFRRDQQVGRQTPMQGVQAEVGGKKEL
jgi:lysophospholipid acyltransferase